MKSERSPRAVGWWFTFFAAAAVLPQAQAQDGDPSNEFRVTLAPHHNIKGDLTGSGELGYYWNPEDDYEAFTALWPGLNYRATHWLQLSAGLRTLYTVHESGDDTLELRPIVGVKLFLPNQLQWHFYNQTRFEFRHTQNLETSDWSHYDRLRTRFGVEIPLTTRDRAWQPKTWYLLADVEPFYRFDQDRVDQVRARGGLGRILSDRVHLELIYHARWEHSTDDRWQHTDNIIQLNFRIGLHEGLLQRLQNPQHDD